MHFATSILTDEDDDELDPVSFEIHWRDRTDKTKVGKETFACFPDVPFGVLLDVEGGAPSAGYALMMAALRDDDHKITKGEQVAGTSSLERYQALTHDRNRKLHPLAISEAMRDLLVEYSARRNPAVAAERPTPLSAPSSGRRSSTGRTSTAKRNGRVSTSGRAARATV